MNHKHDITIIHGFLTGFSIQKIPKSDRCQKTHYVNLDKLFCTCLTCLTNQIGPCHFDWRSD